MDSPPHQLIDVSVERLPSLHISDDEKPKTLSTSSPSLGVFDTPMSRSLSPAERRLFQTMPIQQRPITAFPMQDHYTAWTAPTAGAESSAQATDPSAPGVDDNVPKEDDDRMNIDPVLSSVRSSTDIGGHQALGAPEINLPPETLGSAAATPSVEVTQQAILKEDLLAAPDQGEAKKETPFSRSPELRISHKLAERKRRKEMRDLFDELREQLPADRGMKASKWEILSKSIDYIQALKNQVADAHRTIDMLHRDLAVARGENPSTAWPPSYHNFNTAIPQYIAHAAAAAAPAAAAATPAAPAAATPAPAATPTSQPAIAAAPVAAPAPAAPAPTVQADAQAAATPTAAAVAAQPQPTQVPQAVSPLPPATPIVVSQPAGAQPIVTAPVTPAQPDAAQPDVSKPELAATQ